MENIITILFCLILAIIAFYDFKYRALPVYILILAAIIGFVFSISKIGWNLTFYNSGINTLLISLQLGLTTFYFSIRNRKFINIFDSCLGMGDLFFFVVVILSFSPMNFILFIIFSGLTTLIFYAPRKEKILIPLAGCQAILLFVILIISVLFKIVQPYNDLFLIDIFCN